MKILAIIFHFPPISGGGVIVAVELVNKFAKMGHKVTVVTPDVDWSGAKYEPNIESNVEVIRVKVPSKDKIKIAARRCKKYLQKKGEEIGNKEKFDFVFTIFHPFHLAPSAAVSCAMNLKIPSIVKIDDAVFEKASGIKSIQRKIEKIMHSKTLMKSSHILVVNEETKKIVKNYYNVSGEKILIIPNGVNLSFFNKRKFNKKSILFSGAMYGHRGIDVLLESAPNIIKKIPDVEFNLLGDGPEINNLKKIVKDKKIEKNVKFQGWIDRNKIPEKLSEASIGIGPLKLTTVTQNALPIKILEYMAAGLPIIAKKGTLPKDVLEDGENGFFIDDVDDLIKKMSLLLTDSKINIKMGEKSLEKVQKFSWEKIAKSILDVEKN